MLSIVIPTLNRPQSLVKLVTSLKGQNMSSSSREILVVYNDQAEAALSPLVNDAEVRVLWAEKPGVNHARNHGARQARGDVILFIDDDCVVEDPFFLQSHKNYHDTAPQLPAVGGPYRLSAGASRWDHIYQINNQQWIDSNRVGSNGSLALLGGNTSYKAWVFENGLFFTEEISYGGSETPLNTLLSLQKGPLGYFEDLSITHETQMGLTLLLRKAYRQGVGAALQTKLYGHPLQQTTIISSAEPAWIRRGLELYAFVFMIGYKSKLFGRNTFILIFQEFWSRYILNKKEAWGRQCAVVQRKYWGKAQAGVIKAYWWQHSQIRHPALMFIIRAYWKSYDLYLKFFGLLYRLGIAAYWFFYSGTAKSYLFFKVQSSALSGFLSSLTEPLHYQIDIRPIEKIKGRLGHIFKKFGWLILKTMGLR